MAKIKTCPICGKEYKDAFFGTEESGGLNFGKIGLRESFFAISCCSECSSRYEDIAKREGLRFASKVENLKRASRRRLKDEDIARLFLEYVKDMQNYTPYVGEEGLPISFCYITLDGRFCVNETNTSTVDFTMKDFDKSLEKIFHFDNRYVFGKEDVTKLEYRVIDEDRNMFSGIYTFEIRLNDEKNMTFKPCLAKFFVGVRGFGLKHKADKEMRRLLEVFKSQVGVDLPITKVRKFK